MRAAALCTFVTLLMFVPSTWAQTINVSDRMVIPMAAGEVQSTVVAPGLKPECPNGRFLVTNDYSIGWGNAQAPAAGMVRGRDLNTPDGTIVMSALDAPPVAEHRRLGFDHDLLALANGDVLLVDATMSKVPLFPRPAWFEYAYRDLGNNNLFGPGARTVVLTWRSTDCGQTFHFASEFDTARHADGSCALPQQPARTTLPGTPERPVWDMGGSDGQLARLDPRTNRIYLTHQCVGYQRETSITDPAIFYCRLLVF
jgi:hypothetical protein